MTSDEIYSIPEYQDDRESNLFSDIGRISGTIIFAVMAIMMAALLVAFRIIGIAELDNNGVSTISVNVMAMFMCLAIFLALILDKGFRKPDDKSTLFFFFMWPVLFSTMALDSFAYIIDGIPNLHALNDITNTAVYVSAMITSIVYWYYISNALELPEKFGRVTTVLVNMLGLLFILLMILNHFTGWVFYIAEDGCYKNGPYSFLMGITYVNLVLAFIATVISKASIYERAIYCMVPVIPVVVGRFTDFSGMQLAYPSAAISLLFVYVVIYEKRNVQIVQQQVEIEQRRSAVLNAQIKPHFVNNCMQVILGLMDEKPEEAREALEVFASYLRGSTNLINKVELIDFDEELEFTENYLYLQKLRFEDRFEVTMNIQDRDFKVPALSLQPLVENAVKYAFIGRRGKGHISVTSLFEDNRHRVIINDDGIGFNEEYLRKDKKHVGLYNVQNRVRMMTGGDVFIDSKPGFGTQIIVDIPMK